MIDIGANIGRMSIPRVVLGDATVAYCIEPDPLNYACLVRNIRDNGLAGLAMPDRLAIGAQNGTVRLERAKSPGGHRVLGEGMTTGRETVEVPIATLDAWVDRVGIDLDTVRFVKLDVQGGEVDVLAGAARVLACRHIAWQVEVDVERLSKRGLGFEDLFGHLRHNFTHFTDLNRLATGSRLRSYSRAARGHVLRPPAGGRRHRRRLLHLAGPRSSRQHLTDRGKNPQNFGSSTCEHHVHHLNDTPLAARFGPVSHGPEVSLWNSNPAATSSCSKPSSRNPRSPSARWPPGSASRWG